MINVGIVGLGGAGRAHVRRFSRNPRVGRILGYDINPDLANIEGCQITASLEELLAGVDAVSICTPDHLHLSGIVDCLSANRHVMVEKPMVASYQEAIELKASLERHPDLVFAVHHQMRYAAPFLEAAELVKRGALGKLYYIEANYWHDMRERSSKFDNWRTANGQSLMLGHACHPLDLLMHLAGDEPISHTTLLSKNAFPEYASPYTSATTLMAFPGNLIGKCHVNSCCRYPQFNNLIVMGEDATYVDGVLYKNGEFRQLSDFYGKNQADISLNVIEIKLPSRLVSFAFKTYLRTFNWLAKRLMSHPDFGFRQYPLTVYNHDSACQTMVDNFIASVEGRETPLVGVKDAVRVIKLCEAAERDGLARMQ